MSIMNILSCLVMMSTVLLQNPSLAAEEKITAYTPELLLPAGIDSAIGINPYTGESGGARKGTIATTINNAALLNKLLLNEEKHAPQIREITRIMESLIPSMRVIGIFDFFSVEEWLSAKNQPGRVLIAVLYLKTFPKEVTPLIRQILEQIANTSDIPLLVQEIGIALRC